MTLQQRLEALIQAIGPDIKALYTQDGNLANLNTTAKSNLVASINEVLTIANSATGVINDAATAGTTDKTYSVDKILTVLNDLKQELLGGVPAAAFDTLKEIADYIEADQTAMSGLIESVGNRVSFASAQSLTSAQQLQARENINAYGAEEIGNPDKDLVALYETAKS
jgi:hypothetical protein